ncbi:class I SAM-dependent methyltransferase [Micromonospora sp. NPDC049645]|uniref:class I SAM-dependent methyltransferase n=1 Tax=Micromonospora sp. NPDC049645 TaxID=3155508 RepID=UPI00341D6C45
MTVTWLADRSTHSDLTAEVYQLAKPIDGDYRDVSFYVDLLRGGSGRVLELGCGTGRLQLPLLAAGIDVEGLDHSEGMLERCRAHADERGLHPTLRLGDMATFRVDDPYDVVLLASGLIKELPGRDLARQCLSACRAALRPGGRLYVDLVPPRSSSLAISPDRPTQPAPPRYWRSGDTAWSLTTVLLDYDAATDRTTALRRYEKWQRGALVACEMHEFPLQDWSIETFCGMVADCGFQVAEVFADYRPGRPPGPGDKDWTICAIGI